MVDAPEKLILQPCATYGWEHPDRVKHIGSWGVEYTRTSALSRTGAVKPRLTNAMIQSACKAHFGTAGTDGIEYTRSDIIAELAVENERLKQELLRINAEFDELCREKLGIERSGSTQALASTGAVKASEIVEDAIRRCRELHDYAGRPAWEKALEDAILSALEPHPLHTNIVVSHETANMNDKPEGQQEPVAMKTHGAWDGLEGLDDLPDGTMLYTRPSEQAVSDETELDAAKSAAIELLLTADDVWTDYGSGFRIHFSFPPNSDTRVVERIISARAIKAAMEPNHD